jgi:hypothetical protein
MKENREIEIWRNYKGPTETLGTFNVLELGKIIFSGKTMELPWRNNSSSNDSSKASCIPTGVYIGHKQPAEERRKYDYIRIEKVPGRNTDSITGYSRILFHRITYVKDLLGCIGIGGKFADLNADQVPDMVESGVTLQKLYDLMPSKFKITIKDKQV